MKIMITGGKGMLGRTLQKELSDHELIVADLPECDITDLATLRNFTANASPDAVIHCAAMTAVDKCETEQGLAFRLNETGSSNVAKVCNSLGIRLIAISTDYVFKGDQPRPYTEYDTPSPLTVYGKSKLAGEEQVRKHCPDHVIARISWLYGDTGPSFVHTMLKLADGTRPELKVVADQVGNPTSTNAVARHLRLFLKNRELRGTFHLTCEGEASWYEFAKTIFEYAQVAQKVVPCRTDEFPRPAPRPANSRLEKLRLKENGLPPMPHWQDALKEFLRQTGR